MTRAYEENHRLHCAGTSPRDVVAYQPSAAAKARVADLIQQEKAAGLSEEETADWSTTCSWNTSCDWPRLVPGSTLPMSSYVSAALRRVVWLARADTLCECCLIHEDEHRFWL